MELVWTTFGTNVDESPSEEDADDDDGGGGVVPVGFVVGNNGNPVLKTGMVGSVGIGMVVPPVGMMGLGVGWVAAAEVGGLPLLRVEVGLGSGAVVAGDGMTMFGVSLALPSMLKTQASSVWSTP